MHCTGEGVSGFSGGSLATSFGCLLRLTQLLVRLLTGLLNKLLVTSASLLVTSALLVVTMFAAQQKLTVT